MIFSRMKQLHMDVASATLKEVQYERREYQFTGVSATGNDATDGHRADDSTE